MAFEDLCLGVLRSVLPRMARAFRVRERCMGKMPMPRGVAHKGIKRAEVVSRQGSTTIWLDPFRVRGCSAGRPRVSPVAIHVLPFGKVIHRLQLVRRPVRWRNGSLLRSLEISLARATDVRLLRSQERPSRGVARQRYAPCPGGTGSRPAGATYLKWRLRYSKS